MFPLYLVWLAVVGQAAQPPVRSDDIIVRDRRLSDAQWKCREGPDHVFIDCKLRRTTGDKELDAVLEGTMKGCIALRMPASDLIGCLRKRIEPYVGHPVTGELN